MFTTAQELSEFREKIILLLRDIGPNAITLSELCSKFIAKYGVDYKRCFKQAHKPVPRALQLFDHYLPDLLMIDLKSRAPEIVVRRKENVADKKKAAFQELIQSSSRVECEHQLKQSLEVVRGSSKQNAIEVEEGEGCEEPEDYFEFNYQEEHFDSIQEFKKLKCEVTKFKQYRDFQMIHIAFVKLRIVVLFNTVGKTKLHYHTVCAVFRQLFNESFFQSTVLKQYVTSSANRNENILTFLKRFCGDFLFINDKNEVNVCRSLGALTDKCISSLVKTIEKLQAWKAEATAQNQPELQQKPEQLMLLGRIATENIPVDVRRAPEYSRFPGSPKIANNVLDFPGLTDPEKPVIRLSLNEISDKVNEIREKICSEYRTVKLPEILFELCKHYNVSCIRDIQLTDVREIRREHDIPALNNLMKLQGKINAMAQSFITFRNICTLHEFEEEVCRTEGVQCFEDLKLGPLQKQLIIHDLYQFPPDRIDIPPITTYDVIRLLWRCYDEKFQREKKIKMPDGSALQSKDLHVKILFQDFQEYVRSNYGLASVDECGLRINNVGYALQSTRKAWFSDIHNMKKVFNKFREQLSTQFLQNLEFVKKKTLSPITETTSDGQETYETFHHKFANMPLLDAFTMAYDMLQTIKREACKTLPATAHIINFSDITMNALSVIKKDRLMSSIFHLIMSIAPLKLLKEEDERILRYLGFEKAMSSFESEAVKSQRSRDRKNSMEEGGQPKASKSSICSVIKKWLSKSPSLSVVQLSTLELKITAEVNPACNTFEELGHGTFLSFVSSDENLLEMMNFGSSEDLKSSLTPTKDELKSFLKQCGEGKTKEDLKCAIELQFRVKCSPKSVQQLQQQQKTQKDLDNKSSKRTNIAQQHSFLCASDYHKTAQEAAGKKNKNFTQMAQKWIHSAPLLTELSQCLSWDQIFSPRIGSLKKFITTNFKPPKDSDYNFIELNSRKYIKVLKQCSLDDLKRALNSLNAQASSSCILAMLLSSVNIQDAPMSLLANHMQNALMTKAGKSNNVNSEEMQSLLGFALECFELIPFEILCCIARKLFLTRLGAIFGIQKIPGLLLQKAKMNTAQRQILHALGFQLTINEWTLDAEEFMVTLAQNSDFQSKSTDEKKTTKTDTKDQAPKEEKGDDKDDECGEKSKTSSKPDLVLDCTAEKSTDVEMESVGKANNDVTASVRTYEECRQIIESIRHDDFGVGMEIGSKEQRLLDIHRAREGRSLDRLSRELYTRDSHFVLELIQNADDNEYPSTLMQPENAVKPTVAFIVHEHTVTLLNNERGFEEKHVRALCDIGKSTKGIHRKGYIGQKGIGFKSVFRVTDRPEIHSNGFHLCFDATFGPNGYILPAWVDHTEENHKIFTYNTASGTILDSWMTKIVLPLKQEMQHGSKMASRFHDIHPSLLLFLNRLHTLVIDDKISGAVRIITKELIDEHLVKLTENETTSLWFVVSKEIPIEYLTNPCTMMGEVSQNVAEIKSHPLSGEIKNTNISVAFPLFNEETDVKNLPMQPIFAYLPLRSYGFKFIIQADFEVPSSREDIDADSAWNQCILQYIPQLVAEAFIKFKIHNHFTGYRGIIEYLKFMDLQDHVLGTFKQVARNVITCLQREPCMPTIEKEDTWCLPTSVLLSNEMLRTAVPPEELSKHLGLRYLSTEVQEHVSDDILYALGVTKISVDQLIEIAKSVLKQPPNSTNPNKVGDLCKWIGRWLSVLYVRMQEECDCSTTTMQSIRSLKMFALCDGSFVTMSDEVVFFPVDQTFKRKANDPLNVIEKDLKILSHSVYSNLDQIQHQQVRRLLKDVGVKSMTPSDLISNHIIPLFKDGDWENKPESLLVACVRYMKIQLATDANLFSLEDVRDVIVLKTNKGMKKLRDTTVYMGSEYGNAIDLVKSFPACDWTVVTWDYIIGHSSIERRTWSEFFTSLGLQTFIALQKTTVILHQCELEKSAWKDVSSSWLQNEEATYVIEDFAVPEFERLLLSKDPKQIMNFATLLNDEWKKRFEKHNLTQPICPVKDHQGAVVTVTHPSFFFQLRESKWIPSVESKSRSLFLPRELYQPTSAVEKLFAKTVDYVSPKINNADFVEVLGIEKEVKFERFYNKFKSWCKMATFTTTYDHVMNVYRYIRDTVEAESDSFKLLMKDNCIFVPTDDDVDQSTKSGKHFTDKSNVSGKFYPIGNVCWEDPANVLDVTQDAFGCRRILKGFYPDSMFDFFVSDFGIELYPTTSEYLNAVYDLVNRTILPDRQASAKLYRMFGVLGEKCVKKENIEEVKEWGIPNGSTERCRMYRNLDSIIDQNVTRLLKSYENTKICLLPAMSRKFCSINDNPILCLTKSLIQVFGKLDAIPIITLSGVVTAFEDHNLPSHLRRSKEREIESIMLYVLIFYKACGMQLLADLQLPIDVVTLQPTLGCPFWENFLANICPAVQRFISKNFPEDYVELKRENFKEKLMEVKIFTANRIEVVHRVKGYPKDTVTVIKNCVVQKPQRIDSQDNTQADDKDKIKGHTKTETEYRKEKEIQSTVASEEEVSKEEGLLENASIFISTMSSTGQPFGDKVIKEIMSLFVGDDAKKKEMITEFILTYTTVMNKESLMRRREIPELSPYETVWKFTPSTIKPAEYLEGEIKETEPPFKEVEAFNQDKVVDYEPPKKRAKIVPVELPLSADLMRKLKEVEMQNAREKATESIAHDTVNFALVDMDEEPDEERRFVEIEEGIQVAQHTKKYDNMVDMDEMDEGEIRDDSDTNQKSVDWYYDYNHAQQYHMNKLGVPGSDGFTSFASVDLSEQYEEIVLQHNPSSPTFHTDISIERIIKAKDPESLVGRLGEQVVYNNLCELHKDDLTNGIVDIEWLNDASEHGLPYDLKLTFYDQRQPPIVYIEVKTTTKDERKEFEISATQIRFAFEQGERFHLYRLSGLLNTEDMKLRRLPNLAKHLDSKGVKLFMIL